MNPHRTFGLLFSFALFFAVLAAPSYGLGSLGECTGEECTDDESCGEGYFCFTTTRCLPDVEWPYYVDSSYCKPCTEATCPPPPPDPVTYEYAETSSTVSVGCASGLTLCGADCINLSDPSTCGTTCGNYRNCGLANCANQAWCVAGDCRYTCWSGHNGVNCNGPQNDCQMQPPIVNPVPAGFVPNVWNTETDCNVRERLPGAICNADDFGPLIPDLSQLLTTGLPYGKPSWTSGEGIGPSVCAVETRYGIDYPFCSASGCPANFLSSGGSCIRECGGNLQEPCGSEGKYVNNSAVYSVAEKPCISETSPPRSDGTSGNITQYSGLKPGGGVAQCNNTLSDFGGDIQVITSGGLQYIQLYAGNEICCYNGEGGGGGAGWHTQLKSVHGYYSGGRFVCNDLQLTCTAPSCCAGANPGAVACGEPVPVPNSAPAYCKTGDVTCGLGTDGCDGCTPVCPLPENVDCGNPITPTNDCGSCDGTGTRCDIAGQLCDAGTGICAYPPEICDTPGVDEDYDGRIDEMDPDCAMALTLTPSESYLNIRPAVTAAISATGGVSPSGTKYVCDYQGCNAATGGCAAGSPFCTMAGAAVSCSFTDTTLARAGEYDYYACFGANSAHDVLSIRTPHCSDTASVAPHNWLDNRVAPSIYLHNYSVSLNSWQSFTCDATRSCQASAAICDGTSYSISGGLPRVTCHATNDGNWRWGTPPVGETNCGDNQDNDCDGRIDEMDSECAFTLTLDPPAGSVSYDKVRPAVTATISSATGISPAGTKYVCDYQGCNAATGGCAAGSPFCTMAGAAVSCSFTDTTLLRSGEYDYYACFGANSAGDVLSIRTPHCSAEILPVGRTGPGHWFGDEGLAPQPYVHNYSSAGWQSLLCAASTKDLYECKTVPALCDGSLVISGGVPNVTCHATDAGVWQWETLSLPIPGGETNCTDGLDNDCDGSRDGYDSDCFSNLTGYVYGAAAGSCPSNVTGATVSLLGLSDAYANTSLGNCRYELHDLSSAVSVSVSASKEGYASNTTTVAIPPRSVVTKDFVLGTGDCTQCANWEGRCSISCSDAPGCMLTVPPVCEGARKDTWVHNGTGYVFCCEGTAEKTAVTSPIEVGGDMENLAQFRKIAQYLNQPVTVHVYTWTG